MDMGLLEPELVGVGDFRTTFFCYTVVCVACQKKTEAIETLEAGGSLAMNSYQEIIDSLPICVWRVCYSILPRPLCEGIRQSDKPLYAEIANVLCTACGNENNKM